MKVRLTVTLDIDPEAWDLAYGTGTDRKSIREDVLQYLQGFLDGCSAIEEGGIRSVESVK